MTGRTSATLVCTTCEDSWLSSLKIRSPSALCLTRPVLMLFMEVRALMCRGLPQVLFSGTYRSNLDPAGQFVSDDLWGALEKVHLKEHVMSSDENNEGLDQPIDAGGGNLSVGQRQLMCLAR